MKNLSLLIMSLLILAPTAYAAPTVDSKDIQAKKITLTTGAEITDYCIYGKNDQDENFIACTQFVGDMSAGLYAIDTEPLPYADDEVQFTLIVAAESLKDGGLTYLFVETGVENPTMKSSGIFFDQVKKVIEKSGPHKLEITYIGEDFDHSLFGTPIPLFQ